MLYRKLNRTYSHGYAYLPEFTKVFPELSELDSEELCDRLMDLNMEFYYEQKTPVNPWVRLTLPFALITISLMFVLLPLLYILTGKWGYPYNKTNFVLNWFKSLGLR